MGRARLWRKGAQPPRSPRPSAQRPADPEEQHATQREDHAPHASHELRGAETNRASRPEHRQPYGTDDGRVHQPTPPSLGARDQRRARPVTPCGRLAKRGASACRKPDVDHYASTDKAENGTSPDPHPRPPKVLAARLPSSLCTSRGPATRAPDVRPVLQCDPSHWDDLVDSRRCDATARPKARPGGTWMSSRQLGLLVRSLELLDGSLVDQPLLSQPAHGSAPCPSIPETVPNGDQVRMALVELVLETPERALTLQRAVQGLAGSAVADAFCEVGHVLVPDVRRKGVDESEVQLIELDGVLTVDPGVTGPERDLAGSGVDQPSVLVVGLIREGGSDLLNVDRVRSSIGSAYDFSRLPNRRRSGAHAARRPLWRKDTHMSVSAAHASAFYDEARSDGSLWTIRDADGFPAPHNSSGERSMPFWSLRRRAEKVVATVPCLRGLRACRAAPRGVHIPLAPWTGARRTASGP